MAVVGVARHTELNLTLSSQQLVALAHTVGGVRFSCTRTIAQLYVDLRDVKLIDLSFEEWADTNVGEDRVGFHACCTEVGLQALRAARAIRQEKAEREEYGILRAKYGMEIEFASQDEISALVTLVLKAK